MTNLQAQLSAQEELLSPFRHLEKLDYFVHALSKKGIQTDKSTLSRWMSGQRAAPACVEVWLLRSLSPAKQLQYLNSRLGEYGFSVTDEDPLEASPAEAVQEAAKLTSVLAVAALDGRIDEEERKAVEEQLGRVVATVGGVQ